jgi:hypothetical protein
MEMDLAEARAAVLPRERCVGFGLVGEEEEAVEVVVTPEVWEGVGLARGFKLSVSGGL